MRPSGASVQILLRGPISPISNKRLEFKILQINGCRIDKGKEKEKVS